MESTKQSSKHAAPNPLTHVGPIWFVVWVIWVTLMGTIPQTIQTLTIVNGVSAFWVGAIVQTLTLAALGLRALVLPQPIRQDWLLWIVFSVAGTAAASVIFQLTLQRWFLFIIEGGSLTEMQGIIVVFSLVGAVLTALIVGLAEMVVLLRHVHAAYWWIVALVVGNVFGTLLNWFVNFILAFVGADFSPPLIALITSSSGAGAFFSSITTGVALWLLVANNRKHEATATNTPTD